MVWKNWGRWGTLSPPQFFNINRVQTPLFVSATSHSCQLRDPRQTGHKKKCLYPLFRALPWFRVKAPSGQLGLGSSPASGQLTAVLTLTLGITLGVSCFCLPSTPCFLSSRPCNQEVVQEEQTLLFLSLGLI